MLPSAADFFPTTKTMPRRLMAIPTSVMQKPVSFLVACAKEMLPEEAVLRVCDGPL